MTMTGTQKSTTSVDVQVEAMDARTIGSIQLTTGWEQVRDAQLIQFAVGTAHSPISPTKVYPALRYRNSDGQQVFTPLSQILSFSTEQVQG